MDSTTHMMAGLRRIMDGAIFFDIQRVRVYWVEEKKKWGDKKELEWRKSKGGKKLFGWAEKWG